MKTYPLLQSQLGVFYDCLKYPQVMQYNCPSITKLTDDIDLDRLDTKDLSASLIGSGDIGLHLWNTAETRLALKGSGDIDASFHQNCDAVACELRGSGDITLKGEVKHFSKEKSGSGDVSVGQLSIRP